MAYESIKDSNGVTWTVITTANGFTMIASVLDSADPNYDPAPPDLDAKMSQGGIQLGDIDIVHTDPPTPEQTRTLYIELVGKVQQWAKDHRGATSLKVTAKAPIPWWVWLIGGAVLLRYMQKR
jgi:hypothetical protein